MDSTYSVVAPILPFFGTHTDSILLLYAPGQFFGTLTDSTYSRYSHGFYLFPALARILPFSGTHKDSSFSGTRPDSFSVLSRILPIPGTRTDSTIFRYLPRHFFGTLTDCTYSRLIRTQLVSQLIHVQLVLLD